MFAIIVAIIVGATLFFRGGSEEFGSPPVEGNAGSLERRGSTGLVIGENAIYVAEQAPSRILTVVVVHLQKPGFVVVHEATAGFPGEIFGRSAILQAGETNNPASVSLSRVTRDGETLYVMLHLDDGDGVFNAVKDKPALDPVNALPVMMIITVSAEATEPGAVSL